METLVLTHYVPSFPSGGGEGWRALVAAHFEGAIELGDDLHRVEVGAVRWIGPTGSAQELGSATTSSCNALHELLITG